MPAEAQSTSTVTDLLADRRARLERQRKDREAAEKAAASANAEARREAAQAQTSDAPIDEKRAREIKYAQQQRKRQQEAREERERVLRLVQHNRAERKEKEERRKSLAKAEAESRAGSEEANMPQVPVPLNGISGCAIQVRLLDGSTIRSRFSAEQTLRSDVRTWVDSQRGDDDIPYNFRQIMTPHANRVLSISEEEDSLRSIGLTPSATLVLHPIPGATSAYGSAGPGLLSRGFSAGYGVVASGVGMVASAASTFLGAGPTAISPSRDSSSAPGQTRPDSTRAGAGQGLNVRTLRDQEADAEDRQFYNGNQVRVSSRRRLTSLVRDAS